MSDTADRNREYFECAVSARSKCEAVCFHKTLHERRDSKESSTYDARHERTLGKLIEDIRSHLDFIGDDWVDDDDEDEDEGSDAGDEREADAKGQPKTARKSVRLLDYACGTGTISRALAPYTTQIVGIDLSSGMVAAYNARAENQGLSRDEMFAYQGNLCVPDLDGDESSRAAFSGPEFFAFDVAAVGLGFHHFDDPHLAARRLVERLRPGGVLMIVDFWAHGDEAEGHHHPARHTVAHHGFSEAQMRAVFAGAGAEAGFAMSDIGDMTLSRVRGEGGAPIEVRRRLFIARGTKA